MYALTGDKLVHMKDFPIAEPALVLARDDESVCAALAPGGGGEGRYIVLNIVEGKVVTIIPCTINHGTLGPILDHRPSCL